MKAGKWRIAAGIAALLVMALLGARLLPAYWRNLAFQRSLQNVAQQALSSGASDDQTRINAINAAAVMGIPLRLNQIRLRRAPNRLEIEVIYAVPLEIPLYSVDLHFRPRVRVP